MKPNVGRVEIHEEYWKLFNSEFAVSSCQHMVYLRMALVLVGEGETTVVEAVKMGRHEGVPYGVFDVTPEWNVSEMWVCLDISHENGRWGYVPLLKLLPPEGESHVMEAGKNYAFKIWFKLGEVKLETT